MSIDVRVRLLSFSWTASGGGRIWLRPEGQWTIRGGVAPDSNSASCVYLEYAKLPADKSNLIGTIELWSGGDPDAGGDPDVELKNQTLVNITRQAWGVVASEADPRTVGYVLTFADHRHAWVEPRGGRLLRGQVNVDRTASPDTNSTLVQQCLTAMGALASISTGTLDAVEPARDLDWGFAHAPSELARLLEHTGHGYCPSPATGFGSVQLLLAGSYPTFTTADVVHDFTIGAVDRRPGEVIITSAPAASLRTYNSDAGSPPTWHIVAQDPDDSDRWKPLDEIAQIGADPVAALRDGLPDASDDVRERLRSQMFRCLQIDQERFPSSQCSLLNRVYFPDESIVPIPPGIRLTVAQRYQDGAWVDTDVILYASKVLSRDGVLVFDDRLVKVDGGEAGDLDPFIVHIPNTDMLPTFTVEDWDTDNGERLCGVWGFSLVTVTPTPMDDASARARLTGYRPATAIFNVPELVPIDLNDGASSNATTLGTRSLSIASSFLASSTGTIRDVLLRGLHPMSIDSRVSQIVYDIDRLSTRVILDGWSVAGGH